MIELLHIGKDDCLLDRALWLLFDEFNIDYSPTNPYTLTKWFPIFMNFGASIVSFQNKNQPIEYRVYIPEHKEDVFFFQLVEFLDKDFIL